jgi:hypothetical protein
MYRDPRFLEEVLFCAIAVNWIAGHDIGRRIRFTSYLRQPAEIDGPRQLRPEQPARRAYFIP